MAIHARYGNGPIICVLNPNSVVGLTEKELREVAGINNCEIVVMDAITRNSGDFPFELKPPKQYSWCKNGNQSSGVATNKRAAKKLRNIRKRRSK
ncbi:MAG: hypothetical protein PHV54_01670 [Tolumonas sp.]|nr:hypothetical protein [Tolumonas sp.]